MCTQLHQTTVMLRNIPQKYNSETLMEDMDSHGFNGAYDFLYLPLDFSSKLAVGYAFINFVTKAECARFTEVYDGLKLGSNSPKTCEVCGAKRQGRDSNVEFYRNSTVMGMEEEYHPVLLKEGMRKEFPTPTKPLGRIRRNCLAV